MIESGRIFVCCVLDGSTNYKLPIADANGKKPAFRPWFIILYAPVSRTSGFHYSETATLPSSSDVVYMCADGLYDGTIV